MSMITYEKVIVRMSKNEKRNEKIYFDIQSSIFFFVVLKWILSYNIENTIFESGKHAKLDLWAW